MATSLDLDIDLIPYVEKDTGGYPILTVYAIFMRPTPRGKKKTPRPPLEASTEPNKANTLFKVRPKYETSGPVLRFYLEYGDLIDTYLSKVNEIKVNSSSG